jgi:hypothetical protein
MIYIVIVGVVIAFLLIALIRGGTPSIPYVKRGSMNPHQLGQLPEASDPQAVGRDADGLPELTLETLETFCRQLAEKNELQVKHADYHRDREFHLLAYHDKPLLRGNVIVCGYLTDAEGVVNSDVVIGFSDMVKAERAMKGVFVTNGYFSEEVMKLNEGASMELIDGPQLAAFMEKFTPELLPKRLRPG